MRPERADKIKKVLEKRQNNLTVVLENVFDPHNASAILRSCDAVGVYEVFIINTEKPHRNYIGKRSSASAYKWVKIHHFDDLKTCMDIVQSRYKNILSTHLGKEALSLYEIDLTQPTALLFGNEVKGLSEEICEFATANYLIPQLGMIQSLNISVACAISLYEAYRQKEIAGHYKESTLPQQIYDQTLATWAENKPLT